MTKGLTGIPALAYLGVNAGSPPNIKMYNRDPNINDSQNFIIGDLWINTTPTPPASRRIWMLVSLGLNIATWVMLYPTTAGGGGNLRSDDALISIPDGLGAINVTGGQPYIIGSDTWLDDPVYSNIFTAANPISNTLEVVLKRSIMQPKGTADGLRGLYGIDGDDFMHGFGTGNTMLGPDAGNRTLNVGAATNNTCIGYNTLQSIDTANHCTGLGYNVLSKVVGSGYLIAIGQNAGDNYVLNESSDILIGNPGVAAEDNVIRIGVMGNGNGEQNQVFLAGVWNSPAVPVVNTGLVIVDDSGQLYVDDLAPDSVVMTDATGNPIAVKGALGTVLTGQGAGLADPPPAFLPLTSSGGTVTISTDPVTNAINLEAAGVAGLVQLTTDAGVALPLAGNINVLGGELIETDATVANTVTVNLTRGLDAQVVGGNTGAAPTWKTLGCSDGSLDVIQTPAGIDITVIGVPPVGGINYLMDHALQHVTPTANGILIEQGANITTVGDVPTSKITVSVTDDVTLAGFLHAANEIQTTGVGSCLISEHGNLCLPNTDVADIGGQIKFGYVDGVTFGTRWISNYGTNNTFVGANSGSLALDINSAKDCTFIGRDVGRLHLTGESNTACGSAAFDVNVSGAQCTILGVSAFGRDLGSSYSTCLGWHAGYNCLGSANNSCLYIDNVGVNGESNVIRIGQEGTSAHHQDKCYIAGIYNKVPGPSAEMVTIGSDGKLGTAGIPSGGATTFVTDSGTATVSGTTIQIKGGYNVNTSGATNIVTVNLDDSVLQPITSSDGSDGVYAMGTKGTTTYSTNRFMHAWGGGLGMTGYNTFLGYQSGRLNAAAIGLNNVGIGGLALDAYTSAANNVAIGKNSMTNATSASNSTCVGSGSGSALTTGGSNLLLGLNSGTAYTTESNNITLAHGGVASDSRTMRLGYDTQWNWVIDKTHPSGYGTMTTTGTTSAYAYGIFNSDVDETAAPVYVDKTGKLGTNGGVSYAYHQAASIVDVTGDGTLYVFGTASPLVKDFDATGVVTVGGAGAPAYFTAPFPGKYFFSATITYDIPALPVPPPAPIIVSPLYLLAKKVGATVTTSYMFATYIPKPIVGEAQKSSEVVTAEIFLDKDETVRWACRVSNMTKRIGILSSEIVAYGGLGYTCWATYFTGHRVG